MTHAFRNTYADFTSQLYSPVLKTYVERAFKTAVVIFDTVWFCSVLLKDACGENQVLKCGVFNML